MQIQTIRGFAYLFADTQVTHATIGQAAEASIPKLFATVGMKHIQIAGPLVFIYHNASMNPQAKFKLDIGLPVREDTVVPQGYQKATIEPFKCATILDT